MDESRHLRAMDLFFNQASSSNYGCCLLLSLFFTQPNIRGAARLLGRGCARRTEQAQKLRAVSSSSHALLAGPLARSMAGLLSFVPSVLTLTHVHMFHHRAGAILSADDPMVLRLSLIHI